MVWKTLEEYLLRFHHYISSFLVSGPTWRHDYNRFVAGIGHRKIDPSDPTKFVACEGTPESILHEIKKYDMVFPDLKRSMKCPTMLDEACMNMSRQLLMVCAEWRTFFDNERLDPTTISDPEMQNVADMSYNHWRDFQNVINELKHPTFRSPYRSLKAITKFIQRDREAIVELFRLRERETN
ncbi:hypothetical protein CAEBREN_23276 [Caenorhabditis brenneri]|uniref:Uncharacterized protein n=1 Tax=Caenorhabditis brenneri TaxID=135651 RepID=G0NNQ6_CAEBE|nr:hypothetical protein CAEBREN_23276 [Caenorhabditis brenneri]